MGMRENGRIMSEEMSRVAEWQVMPGAVTFDYGVRHRGEDS